MIHDFMPEPDFRLTLLCSFIHIEHLYSVPSRKLLRGAPDSSTAKKNSFKVRKLRRREGHRKEAKLQREAIPGRGTHHRESASMSVDIAPSLIYLKRLILMLTT